MNPQNEIKHLKNFNNSLAIKVDECLQEISTLRTQLKSVEAECDNANLFRERNRVALNRRDDALRVATTELERLRFNVEMVDKVGIDKCLHTINELIIHKWPFKS